MKEILNYYLHWPCGFKENDGGRTDGFKETDGGRTDGTPGEEKLNE